MSALGTDHSRHRSPDVLTLEYTGRRCIRLAAGAKASGPRGPERIGVRERPVLRRRSRNGPQDSSPLHGPEDSAVRVRARRRGPERSCTLLRGLQDGTGTSDRASRGDPRFLRGREAPTSAERFSGLAPAQVPVRGPVSPFARVQRRRKTRLHSPVVAESVRSARHAMRRAHRKPRERAAPRG
jgi:hypothetical protein